MTARDGRSPGTHPPGSMQISTRSGAALTAKRTRDLGHAGGSTVDLVARMGPPFIIAAADAIARLVRGVVA